MNVTLKSRPFLGGIVKFILAFFCLGVLWAEPCELVVLGEKYDNEKGQGHDYFVIYDRYFAPLKNKPLKILEIGFAAGSSAHIWEDYFPNAELHFIDIEEGARQSAKDLSARCHLHIGDQGEEAFLSGLVAEVGSFDIIIDDASHQVTHQVFTFEYLFPFLNEGGIYVIEDLHTSYWKAFGGLGNPGNPKASALSATEYLKGLVDRINYVGAYTGCANRELAKIRVDDGMDKHGRYNFPKDFFDKLDEKTRDILSIHFYDSICFILKR